MRNFVEETFVAIFLTRNAETTCSLPRVNCFYVPFLLCLAAALLPFEEDVVRSQLVCYSCPRIPLVYNRTGCATYNVSCFAPVTQIYVSILGQLFRFAREPAA